MPDQTTDPQTIDPAATPPMWTQLLDTARSLARTGTADEIGELMCEAYTVGVVAGQQRQFERLLAQIDQLRTELADEQAAHAKTASNFEEYCESLADAATEARRSPLASVPSCRAQATQEDLPPEWELALLRQANAEDGLDVAEDELLDHGRTQTYRQVIRAAYRACYAALLGYEVTVGELGDRLHIGDRIAPATGGVVERPVDLVDRTAGRR